MWPSLLEARFISNFANRFAIAHDCQHDDVSSSVEGEIKKSVEFEMW